MTHPTHELSAYLDGEMPAVESAAVETHLAGCAGCRLLLDDFRALAAAAAREPVPEVPEELQARIRQAIEADDAGRLARRQRAGRFAFVPYLALAAAAAAVVTIGVWVLQPERQEDRQVARMQAPPAEPPPAALPSAEPPPAERRPASEPAPAPRPPAAAVPESGRPAFGRLAPPVRAGAERRPPAAEPSAAHVTEADGAKSATVGDASPSFQGAIARPAPAPALPAHRWLEFEYPEETVRLSETGTVTMRSKTAACVVDAAGGEAEAALRELFAVADADLRAGSGIDSGPQRGPQAGATAGSLPRVPSVRLVSVPADASGLMAHGVAALPQPGPAPVPGSEAGETRNVSPRGAADLQVRLEALLRAEYLARLRERCGSVPRSLRAD